MKNQEKILFVILLFMIVITFFLSCIVGRYPLPISSLYELLTGEISKSHQNVLCNLRIPRAIASILMGGSLGLAGAIFQKVFHSPLASPDILGIANGASLGAVLSIVFFTSSMWVTQIMAFFFGIGSLFIILFITQSAKAHKLFAMIVAGVIVSSIASSVVMLLKYMADPERNLPAIEYWIMGGLYNIRTQHNTCLFFVVLVSGFLLYVFRWRFLLLSLEDTEIQLLGVSLEQTRYFFLFIGTLLVSVSVSIGGVIGFIGFMAPYIGRLLLRGEESSLRNSFCIGGILLGFGDMIARTIHESEIPVGIIISIIATPFLFYMLRTQKE